MARANPDEYARVDGRSENADRSSASAGTETPKNSSSGGDHVNFLHSRGLLQNIATITLTAPANPASLAGRHTCCGSTIFDMKQKP
jgi:hypothetical protein